MDLATSASGGKEGRTFEKVKECKYGPMEVFTRAIGKRIKQTFSADFCIKMETFTRGNGRTTKPTDSDTTSTKTGPYTEVSGRMTLKTVGASSVGLMGLSLKEIMSKGLNRVTAHSRGQMATATKDNLRRITFKEKVSDYWA